jgi:glycosyltransferase involved in cell wall biosynthesis
MIRWVAQHSAAMITVCQALKDTLIDLGASEAKVTVLRNGVDLVKFSPPKHRESLRSKLNIKSDAILSVGHLIARKGHDLVIKALAHIPNMVLFIAGTGPERDVLGQLVDEMSLGNRVVFLGEISPEQLCEYYGAVDALILASSREGWANVLLEAMACGTPVVATNVWGTPEVVKAPEAGRIVVKRDAKELANTINKLFADRPDRNETRSYAEKFSWDETTMGQLQLFKNITEM